MMIMMVVPNHIFQQEINNIFGYCFPYLIRNSPSLPLMYVKLSLIIVEDMLMRLMNIKYLVGDYGRLFIESWNF